MPRLVLFIGIFIACQVAHVVGSIWMMLAALTGHSRGLDIAIGYDYLGNAITGGKPGELISTRANRGRREGRRWACVLCRLLDRVDKGHCDRYPSD